MSIIPMKFNKQFTFKNQKSKRSTPLKCYQPRRQSGWCGTCKETAKKGEPGYCGDDAANAKDKKRFRKEMARPTGWGGWGYCDQLCDHRY